MKRPIKQDLSIKMRSDAGYAPLVFLLSFLNETYHKLWILTYFFNKTNQYIHAQTY